MRGEAGDFEWSLLAEGRFLAPCFLCKRPRPVEGHRAISPAICWRFGVGGWCVCGGRFIRNTSGPDSRWTLEEASGIDFGGGGRQMKWCCREWGALGLFD